MSHKNNNPSVFYIIKRIFYYIWLRTNMRLRIGASIILTIIITLLNLTIPLVFKHIIHIFSLKNAAVISPSINLVMLILGGYGIVWIITQCVIQLRTVVLYKVLERSMRLLMLDTLEKLHVLSMRYHNDKSTGALTSIIHQSQAGLEQFFWGFLLFLIPTILEALFSLGIITFFYGPFFGFGIGLMLMSYIIISIFITHYALKINKTYNQKRALAQGHLVDSILNIEAVKYFNRQKYEYEYFDRLLIDQEAVGFKKHTADSLVQLFQGLIIGLGLMGITVITGRSVYFGYLGIDDFVLINGYLLQLFLPLQYIGYTIRMVYKAIQDVGAILNIIDLESEIKDIHDALSLPSEKIEIVFENVSFSYDTRKILNNISFKIGAGQTVAIVGHTGSGKSTIAKLLFRFYDATSGSISINGHNIRTIAQASLYKTFGIAPQDPFLFNNSLYYNIVYGNPHSSMNGVEQAIQYAGLNNLITRLPERFDTLIGERGTKISGGEKQLIGIARLLLKQPALYIFDEATSALDNNTENLIRQNIDSLLRGSTKIIIAHRLSTVVNADSIIVLKQGEIVEQGTHSELLNNKGHYYQLWDKQSMS